MGIFDFLKGKSTEEKLKEETQEKKDQIKLKENQNKPLKMLVEDVYDITGIGPVIVGKIETGVMEIGQEVTIHPSGAKGKVKTIEQHHKTLRKATVGENIGVNITGISKEQVKRGYHITQ